MPTAAQPIYFMVGTRMLGTAACRILKWDSLYDDPPMRGQNEPMPGAAGRRVFDLVPDEQEVTIFLQLNGAYDDDGAPEANPREALTEYLHDLKADLTAGTVLAFEWHDLGQTLGADAQVIGLKGTRLMPPHYAFTSLDLVLPPVLDVIP